MKKKLNDSERILKFMEAEETDLFFRSAFAERGEFLWERWPFGSALWSTLVAAARSHRIGCVGGLITERNQPNALMKPSADRLRDLGLLGERESHEEFQPTKLGWAMLEHFATPEELNPPEINQKGFGHAPRRTRS